MSGVDGFNNKAARDLAKKVISIFPDGTGLDVILEALAGATASLTASLVGGDLYIANRAIQLHTQLILHATPHLCAVIAAQNATPETETLH